MRSSVDVHVVVGEHELHAARDLHVRRVDGGRVAAASARRTRRLVMVLAAASLSMQWLAVSTYGTGRCGVSISVAEQTKLPPAVDEADACSSDFLRSAMAASSAASPVEQAVEIVQAAAALASGVSVMCDDGADAKRILRRLHAAEDLDHLGRAVGPGRPGVGSQRPDRPSSSRRGRRRPARESPRRRGACPGPAGRAGPRRLRTLTRAARDDSRRPPASSAAIDADLGAAARTDAHCAWRPAASLRRRASASLGSAAEHAPRPPTAGACGGA